MTMKLKLFGTPTLLTQNCQSIILISWNFNWSSINGNNQIHGWETGKKKKKRPQVITQAIHTINLMVMIFLQKWF